MRVVSYTDNSFEKLVNYVFDTSLQANLIHNAFYLSILKCS